MMFFSGRALLSWTTLNKSNACFIDFQVSACTVTSSGKSKAPLVNLWVYFEDSFQCVKLICRNCLISYFVVRPVAIVGVLVGIGFHVEC